MELQLDNHRTFRDIQMTFNRVYPYLWLEFFYHANQNYGHAKSEMINPDTIIENLCSLNGNNSINIADNTTVTQLEKDFLEILDVKIKVLRKSGNVWVGTSYTSNWTLENQNFEGEQFIL